MIASTLTTLAILATSLGPRPLGLRAAYPQPLLRAQQPRCSATSYEEGDYLISAISGDGSISVKAVVTTALVSEASKLQGLGGLAAAAVGRALTCTMLVSDGLKDEESFQVKFAGDGPLRGVFAVSNGRLESRGYVGNPAVTLPPNAKGKLDVGGGVGKGSLQVVRTKQLPGATTPTQYSSITEIKSGEIPEDINYFLHESEQKEGALAAGVYVQGSKASLDPAYPECADVKASGGWYVSLLPFADEAMVERLQANIMAMEARSPSTIVREGPGAARRMIEALLDGMDPQFFDGRRVPGLVESCPCSEERVLRTLRLLPRDEIDDILAKNEEVEAKCEFCGTRFTKSPDEIAAYLDIAPDPNALPGERFGP